jgi:predicted nuclease of predicted toxin-antitoxin system
VSVAFYMDVQVPAAITRALMAKGVDTLTAQADGSARLSDPALLDRAGELGRVMFTRDEDFLAETAARQQTGVPFAGVVYAHQLRVTIGQCVRDLEIIGRCGEAADMVNRVEHLPLA